MNLKGKKIVLGITGGIAAYKCAELVRSWVKNGAEVKTIMTNAAQNFVKPLTFETLTSQQVYTELFLDKKSDTTLHINLADWADVLIVIPATQRVNQKNVRLRVNAPASR